jgi:hypothetical protein
VSQMVRSRRSFVCSQCGYSQIKWSGFCGKCKSVDTMKEKQILPPKVKQAPTQRSIGERAKRSERAIAKSMTAVDGPDPEFSRIASSTGRVGHITNLQFDAVSRSYVTENKNRVMPSWLIKAWVQINQIAEDYHKAALLHVEPPNMPKTFPLHGKSHNLGTMAIISKARHDHLIARDRKLSEIEELVLNRTSVAEMAYEIDRVIRS